MRFKQAALGGTFDRIHAGHEALFFRAFAVADKVTIGLTSDAFVAASKPAPGIDEPDRQPYGVRQVKLEEWLNAHTFLERATIVPLTDTYGPTVISDAFSASGDTREANDRSVAESYDVLVVSEDSKASGEALNAKRASQGLPPLPIEVVPMVCAEDGTPISSTRIRRGDIDGNGTLIMPAPLKDMLSKPMGPVVANENLPTVADGDRGKTVVAVGDEIASKLVSFGIIPSLTIVDRHSRRQPYDWQAEAFAKLLDGAREIHCQSGPGYISDTAMSAIATWATTGVRTVLVVDGEEDLLTLPVIYRAPHGTVVYYGQPHEGAVRVTVDEVSRKHALTYLEKFLPDLTK